MAPCPAGTASCMYRPRLCTSFTASAKFNVPAATKAEYSPRLCPATKSAPIRFSESAQSAAMETVRIAGCVLAVSFNSSSVPSKQIFDMEKPSALSASAKIARAAGDFSASSLPMPAYCEACPGNMNATLPIIAPLSGRHACAWVRESSCSIFSFTCARASPAATRIAFLTALALERPWPMTQTPRTPSSGAPPYSE